MSLYGILLNFIVLFTAISVHEFSHGLVAYWLGDPTAKNQGRLTLNPISHLDLWGAVCMVLFRFGWAKPVPVNPMYFNNRKRGMALVAIAGPLSNILLAFLSALIFIPLYILLPKWTFILDLVRVCAQMNIMFAIFNLIPFPPLDGSKILGAVLPYQTYYRLLQYERYGTIALLILSFTGILGRIISVLASPLFNLWYKFVMLLVGVFVK